jgi:hypothetical protein
MARLKNRNPQKAISQADGGMPTAAEPAMTRSACRPARASTSRMTMSFKRSE